jgi:hypothetical protein
MSQATKKKNRRDASEATSGDEQPQTDPTTEAIGTETPAEMAPETPPTDPTTETPTDQATTDPQPSPTDSIPPASEPEPQPTSPPPPIPDWKPPTLMVGMTAQKLEFTFTATGYYPPGSDQRPDVAAHQLMSTEVYPQLRKAAEEFAATATDSKDFDRLTELKRVLSGNLELASTNAHVAATRAKLYLNSSDPDLQPPAGMSEAEAAAHELERESTFKAEVGRLQTALATVEGQLKGATPALYVHQRQHVENELSRIRSAAIAEMQAVANKALAAILETGGPRLAMLHWLHHNSVDEFINRALTIPRPH